MSSPHFFCDSNALGLCPNCPLISHIAPCILSRVAPLNRRLDFQRTELYGVGVNEIGGVVRMLSLDDLLYQARPPHYICNLTCALIPSFGEGRCPYGDGNMFWYSPPVYEVCCTEIINGPKRLEGKKVSADHAGSCVCGSTD